MSPSISSLYRFQIDYLLKLVDNIPEPLLYEKQLDGYNSPGWLLGHIYVEAEDVFNHLDVPYEKNEQWRLWFANTTGKVESLINLPSKSELITKIAERYETLLSVYENLTAEQRTSDHPSPLIKHMLPDLDSWAAHHLTTHISIHCGNIAVWKKMMGLEVGGY